MPDTRRTLAANLALLADNSTQDIAPQDHRDSHLSASDVWGLLYFSTPGATTIAVAGTFVKAAGTTTEVDSHADVTVSVANRVTWGAGQPTIKALVTAFARVDPASGTKDIAIAIAKNGTVIASSRMTALGVVSGTGALVMTQTVVELAASDYVELWVTNDTDTTSVTVEEGHLLVKGLYV